jgi:hypothetical protein
MRSTSIQQNEQSSKQASKQALTCAKVKSVARHDTTLGQWIPSCVDLQLDTRPDVQQLHDAIYQAVDDLAAGHVRTENGTDVTLVDGAHVGLGVQQDNVADFEQLRFTGVTETKGANATAK